MRIKKYLALGCAAALASVMLSGCGGGDVTESTVELKKSGRVTEYTIEDFSEEYYDSEELASYIDSEVEAWTSENDGTVKVKKSEVKDQTAYLTIQYDSADTFSDFNGVECFAGSILQAQSAGYDFDTDFVAADADASDDGDSSEEAAEIQTVLSKDDVLGNDDLKVFIVQGHENVIVPGTIAYVSAAHTVVTGKNTVSVEFSEEASEQDVLVYVLYE